MLLSYTAGALFPSLRFLSWVSEWPFPLLHFTAQSLRILRLYFERGEIPEYRNILDSAGNLIKRFGLYIMMPHQ